MLYVVTQEVELIIWASYSCARHNRQQTWSLQIVVWQRCHSHARRRFCEQIANYKTVRSLVNRATETNNQSQDQNKSASDSLAWFVKVSSTWHYLKTTFCWNTMYRCFYTVTLYCVD